MNLRKFAVALCAMLSLSALAEEPVKPEYLVTRDPARHALVIGNAVYAAHEAIGSAATDAETMERNLKTFGYRVQRVSDLKSRRELLDLVLPEFTRNIAPGDIVVLYYSGHGFGHGPYNYLVPASMPKVVYVGDLKDQAITIEELTNALRAHSPAMLLFLIDACRGLAGFVIDRRPPRRAGASLAPAPLDGPTTVKPQGMAPQPDPDFTTNIVTVYAAAPGSLAEGSNASGVMSLFTRSLATRMMERDAELRAIVDNVTADVRVMSGMRQQPTMYRGTASDLFLGPMPAAVIDAHRTAWLNTLAKNSYSSVQWFSYRFAASPFAAPAKKWMSDHAGRPEALEFTLADPRLVESAWGQRAAITVPTGGMAFPRTGLDISRTARRSPGDPGVLLPGQRQPPASSERLAKEVERMVSGQSMVAVRDFIGREAPSSDAKAVVRLPFGTRFAIAGIEKRDVDGVWVRARTPDAKAPVYVNLEPRSSPTQPIELGQSLRELVVSARAAFPYLVEETGVQEVLAALNKEGRKVTWVSIATPAVEEKLKHGDQQARVAHVIYLLKAAGIDGKRITAVDRAPDIAENTVRLRIFGH